MYMRLFSSYGRKSSEAAQGGILRLYAVVEYIHAGIMYSPRRVQAKKDRVNSPFTRSFHQSNIPDKPRIRLA